MRKEEKKYRFLLITGIVMLSVLVSVAFFGKKGAIQLKDIRQKKMVLQAEIDKLGAENQKLKEKIHAFRSDKKEVEELARKELGLVKKGEVVYEFIQEKD